MTKVKKKESVNESESGWGRVQKEEERGRKRRRKNADRASIDEGKPESESNSPDLLVFLVLLPACPTYFLNFIADCNFTLAV
jgi:hypothetical protein